MLFVQEPLRFHGTKARAERLADAFYCAVGSTSTDIICLQEHTCHRKLVLKSFIHHKFHTKEMMPSVFSGLTKFKGSGLTILSRYPIVEQEDLFFRGRSYHLERFVAKGAMYVKIAIPHIGFVHVINTHLNAWSTGLAAHARNSQVLQLRDFVTRKNLPPNEPLFICGDLNMDGYEDCAQLQETARRLKVRVILPEDISYTFDPQTNAYVGVDDISEYALRHNPDGQRVAELLSTNTDISTDACYRNIINNDFCPCCPQQLLDHIMVNNAVHSAVTHVQPVKTPAPFMSNFSLKHCKFTQDVSDHYPLICSSVVLNPQPLDMNAVDMMTALHIPDAPFSLGWFLVYIGVFTFYMLLFFFLWRVVFKRQRSGSSGSHN